MFKHQSFEANLDRENTQKRNFDDQSEQNSDLIMTSNDQPEENKTNIQMIAKKKHVVTY